MKSKLKWFILGALILIVILAIFGRGKGKNVVTVTSEVIEKRDISESIPANGKIKPVIEVKISPDVSGEIVELNFKEGDYVKKGDLIIKIKQDVYISMRDRAEASLNAVKAQFLQQSAQMKQIESSYQRSKKLYEQKAISESEYETALSQYEVTKEQLKAAEFNVKSSAAALKEAQENLIKTTIYSPMDGIISKMSIERGERVVGTTQMAGTEMFRVADLSQMEVLVDVNENDIIRVNPNDTALIEVDAYPSEKFKGVVTQIANSAKNVGGGIDQVTNFEVKIFILPESYSSYTAKGANPFRPGMSASVSIETEKIFGTLAVPLQAITTRNDLFAKKNLKKVDKEVVEQVFVINKDSVEVRKITTGIQDLNYIEVKTGLKLGEKIVIAPYSAISKTLKSGSKVAEESDKKGDKKKSTEITIK